MANLIDDGDAEILRVLETLPINEIHLDWVKLMVGAWNEANQKVKARTDCNLTVSNQHEVANALLLADSRSCKVGNPNARKMGWRHSRVDRIEGWLMSANACLWKLDFQGFERNCEWIESNYRKSTVYEALRKLYGKV
jgi:hypothetical protein